MRFLLVVLLCLYDITQILAANPEKPQWGPVMARHHWADNMQKPDIMEFAVSGDSAPDRRFNYRYMTKLISVSKPNKSSSMQTVDVTKFGAVPDDGKDDTSAVAAALDECMKHQKATLVFSKGRYNLDAGKASTPGVLFRVGDHQGLTIEGQGAELMVRGVTSVFAFSRCKNVTIRRLTLDWERPPFSLGRVVGVKGDHFDVKVFDDYPVKGGETVGALMEYDPKTRLPLRQGREEYYSVTGTELIAPQTLRIKQKTASVVKPGVLILLRHTVYDRNAFIFARCENTVVEDVTIHTAPGMGFNVKNCKDNRFRRVRIVPKPGSGHVMSATADGLHLSGCTGLVEIKDCEFEGMGDDAANIYPGLYLTVKEKIDDRTVRAVHNLGISDPPDPGDTVQLLHQDDLLIYATRKVKSVLDVPNGKSAVWITFNEPLPAEFRVGDVIGTDTRLAKIRISGCTVRNNRARGFLVQSRDAIVENCKFENCTSGGVWAMSEVAFFYQTTGVENLTVRNNTFINCNYAGPIGEGVLSVYSYLNNFKFPTKPGVHKNITFEGNRIYGADNCAILATGVDGLVIRNNRIEHACSKPTNDLWKSAIYLIGSRNVRIEGNTVEPAYQGEGFGSAVGFGEGTDRSSVTVSGNKGF